MSQHEDINQILSDLSAGRKGAVDKLLPLVYDELHARAEQYMRAERRDHTLQPTALVHEAYLRLGGKKDDTWDNREQFMRVAARAMRRVLINHAMKKRSEKRGGGWHKNPLDVITVFLDKIPAEMAALGEALKKISEVDPQMVEIIELRFFGGFTVEATARILGISPSTVNREWKTAKAWLKQEILGET